MSNKTRQTSLDLREYDLPPQWDGVDITWDNYWNSAPPVRICPPQPPDPCKNCARVAPSSTKGGKVADQPNELMAWRKPQAGTPRLIYRFLAYRCSHCGHDYVEDSDTKSTWDLGDEDYGPRGSYTITDST